MDNLSESIELYKSGLSIPKVCAATGINSSRLHRNLKKLGATRSNKENSRRYAINHNFFSSITTEAQAYWLGMLYADGHVTGTNRMSLCLKETDSPHLELFLKHADSNYVVKHYIAKSYGTDCPYGKIVVTSEPMFNDLVRLGVVKRKSLVLRFPSSKLLPKSLTNHFVRGYFDGDGSFSKSHDGYTVKICGTKEFLTVLSESMGFPNRKLSKRLKNKKNTYSLEIGGRKQVLQIGEYLYKNASVMLERKHARWHSLKAV